MAKPKKQSFKPPPTEVFERNKTYALHRGFAFKMAAKQAKEKFGLDAKEKVVWIAPDGKSILPDSRAVLNNARRRSSLNLSDSWNDLKAADPNTAKNLGWNGYQKLMKQVKGSRVSILQRLQKIGLDMESEAQLIKAADGEFGDNNGWGDSG